MANPAELLLEIFESWHSEKDSAQTARKDKDLIRHFRAARLIQEIEELLDSLDSLGKRTSVYRKYLPHWKNTVFLYPNGWTQTGTGKIGTVQRQILETLIDPLDSVTPNPDQQKVDLLRGYLDQVLQDISEDDSLPASVRDSAVAVTNNLIGCIDDLSVLGDFAFSQAYERLIGCLALVALRSSKKSKWKAVLDGLIYPYAVNNLPGVDSAAKTFQEITSAVIGQ